MYMYKKKRTEKYRYVYQHFKFKEILSMNADIKLVAKEPERIKKNAFFPTRIANVN